MSMVPQGFLAVLVAMIVAPLGVAGDSVTVATNSDRAGAAERCDDGLGQVPGAFGMRRPYEKDKVPVVLIHGLWGF